MIINTSTKKLAAFVHQKKKNHLLGDGEDTCD